MPKVIINGPESSGKTTISEFLVKILDAKYIQDYTRIYLEFLDHPYQEDDLLIMADDIKDLLDELDDDQLWIIDTDMINIKIWYSYKFGDLPKSLANSSDDYEALHMICRPDMPWEADPLREHPTQRDDIFNTYTDYYLDHKIPFQVLSGDHDIRSDQALLFIEEFLEKIKY